jgi:putative phosphoesterase
MARIGVISDTHDLLRPEAIAALKGVKHILHTGDICSGEILTELGRIAPVTAVRGNNDKGTWAKRIPATDVFTVGGHSIYLIHDLKELDLDPAAAGFAAVIAGHSHKPKLETRDGVLFLNPGSAGPRRFKLPVTLATLDVSRAGIHAEIHELLPTPSAR